jgi:hypothetical protein
MGEEVRVDAWICSSSCCSAGNNTCCAVRLALLQNHASLVVVGLKVDRA